MRNPRNAMKSSPHLHAWLSSLSLVSPGHHEGLDTEPQHRWWGAHRSDPTGLLRMGFQRWGRETPSVEPVSCPPDKGQNVWLLQADCPPPPPSPVMNGSLMISLNIKNYPTPPRDTDTSHKADTWIDTRTLKMDGLSIHCHPEQFYHHKPAFEI